MIGQCIRWIKRWDPRSPRPAPLAVSAIPAAASTAQGTSEVVAQKHIEVRGHADGWLRVLRAEELLQLVHSARATEAMWRQSRLSAVVWRRDLLPALNRYAEYVQLMPASESHHHAHVGGLLSHTLEMTLAAMTWRNGHFFPEGAQVEEMDAQRDEWTYVVFFSALLHDLGKIMTDLRVSWSCTDMDEPLRWVPMSGPLTEMVQARPRGEYLVEFTPKSARDYQAHSKLPMILLQQIAPPSALSFLARRPQAFDALSQYLSGGDKTSQLASVVRKADQASTQKALANGSRARFSTSTSVALIDLLMLAIKDMLKSGTALPLNRSGAAGWVYDGAIWFVAKRLADGVRQHIKQRYPEEAIPGENKNDRLFDTWQEYGCIQLNPQSGQAVWYVQVHGGDPTTGTNVDPSSLEEGGAIYSHTLTTLRFPLNKLFADEAQYPPAMVGRIEIQQKRGAASTDQETGANHQPHAQNSGASEPAPAADTSKHAAGSNTGPIAATVEAAATSSSPSGPNKGYRAKNEPALRAPSFGKPKVAPSKASKAPEIPKTTVKPTPVPASPPAAPDTAFEPLQMGGPDGFSAKEKWLDFEDDAALYKTPSKPGSRPTAPIVTDPPKVAPTSSPATPVSPARLKDALPAMPTPPPHRPLLVRAGQPSNSAKTEPVHSQRIQHAPVVLTPFLPELPHETASKQGEPSSTAMAFISWLQQGLANRKLKYNESGAMIHFTAEGMALVSPLVFKTYVAEQEPANNEPGAEAQALQVQREVIKAGWHLMGPGKTNILKYQVLGRGSVAVGKLSAVVLIRPERWVLPVPPSNPVLQIT